MSFKLYNGDCLEVMKAIPDNSIDLIFCDLPYGCTNCAWDCPIDLDKLWLEYMRIKKLNTPIFLTTTTKFGVNLINTAPKILKFFDLVWVKSAPTGFLLAKKFPLRKHEMVYVFYEKLPLYDLSSHKHKFMKEKNGTIDGNKVYEGKKVLYRNKSGLYDPPLPVSVIKADEVEQSSTIYNNVGDSKTPTTKHGVKGETTGQPRYDPPLPVSVIKEEMRPTDKYKNESTMYGNTDRPDFKRKGGESMYEPSLPTSILEIASQRSKHSTQKPVDLMKWVLKYYSKENDIILDNCMGSGSTGVACLEMKRRFIGIEKDKDIFKVAEGRLS
tara:strand:+ start:273 stop:1253 length:981 start_codon:yes stop_codon:yes gene_type:complete